MNDRQVPVEAAMLAMGLLSMVEAVHRGVPRREAARQSYVDVFSQPVWDRDVQEMMRLDEFRHGVRCVSDTAREARALILTPRELLPTGVPCCQLPGWLVSEVAVWLESVRRIMLGELPVDAGRSALDAAAGRPRRQRDPLDEIDLLARVDGTRAALESALRRQGLWQTPVGVW